MNGLGFQKEIFLFCLNLSINLVQFKSIRKTQKTKQKIQNKTKNYLSEKVYSEHLV